MLRLFVGIALPPELKLRLSILCSGVPGARWADPGNYHLTLRFIGEVDEGLAGDIDAALAQLRAPRFDVSLAGVGHFGDRMLWVGVEKNPALVHLRDKVESVLVRLGLPPETRRYAPHVTLARLRNANLAKLQSFIEANALFRADAFRVERFSLVASYQTKSGALYEDQADYTLR
jgi:RNA 2',3'-cyclic 3'-phosphodiesterase